MENNANEAHIFWKSPDQQTEVWMKQVSGKTPEDILQELLGEFGVEITEKTETRFACNCSKERMEKALISIGRKDLEEMIKDGEPIEMNCHFCNSHYQFSVEELKKILAQAKKR